VHLLTDRGNVGLVEEDLGGTAPSIAILSPIERQHVAEALFAVDCNVG
jgi:hypothetical protein